MEIENELRGPRLTPICKWSGNVRLEGFENRSRDVGGDVLGNVDKEVDKEVSNNDVKKVANENIDINVTTSSIHTHQKPIHENVDKISINVTTSAKNAHLKITLGLMPQIF